MEKPTLPDKFQFSLKREKFSSNGFRSWEIKGKKRKNENECAILWMKWDSFHSNGRLCSLQSSVRDWCKADFYSLLESVPTSKTVFLGHFTNVPIVGISGKNVLDSVQIIEWWKWSLKRRPFLINFFGTQILAEKIFFQENMKILRKGANEKNAFRLFYEIFPSWVERNVFFNLITVFMTKIRTWNFEWWNSVNIYLMKKFITEKLWLFVELCSNYVQIKISNDKWRYNYQN